jgi:DNA-binding GntR family transcriptional regulator
MKIGTRRGAGGGDAHSLYGDLFSDLREDILTERLKPGEKLTEQRICEAYKVSRTPVREALKQLATEGLTEMLPNRSAFVLGFSRGDMEDIFELRGICETQAARRAIERVTESRLAEFDEILEFMEFYTKKRDIKKLTEININFHQAIHDASECRMLRRILSSQLLYIRHSSRVKPYGEESISAILAEHRRICDAFRAADAEAGADAMRAHMEKARARAFE